MSLFLIPPGYSGLEMNGSTMVEMIIVVPVLMLLGLGTVQAGLLYHAKTTLNYATFEAARKGAVTNGKKSGMKKELGLRLGPVFGGDGSPEDAMKSMMSAVIDVRMPGFTELNIINPTVEAFDDWGVPNSETGTVEIPNSHLRQRHSERVPGLTSGVTLQDANLLKIEVTYGYRMSVPLVDKLFARAMMLVDPGNAVYYSARRMPLTSVATVRMQSPAQQDGNLNIAANSTQGNPSPTNLVTENVVPVMVSCDPHGIRDDLDNDALDNLFNADPGLSCPGVSVLTGMSAFTGSTTLFNPAAENQSSFTNCLP